MMSLKIFTIVLVAVIGISHGLPAFSNPDAEVIDTYASGSSDFTPLKPGMGDWGWFSMPDFRAIQDYITRVTATIAEAIAGGSQGIDLSKGNTTSETKIIDGNRVVINRTEYNENGIHVIVKNVEMQSLSNDKSTEAIPSGTNSTPLPSTEDIETFGEQHVKDNEHLETLDDVDFIPLKTDNDLGIETMDEYAVEYDLSKDIDVNKIAKPVYNDDVEEFDVDSINNDKKQYTRPLPYQSIKVPKGPQVSNVNKEQELDNEEVLHDLSGDTYVNDLLVHKDESGDWEHFPRAHMQPQPSPSRLSHLRYQVFPEDVSGYHDLSRDTYVNEVAAKRGMPKNPDAEEFDVETFNPHAETNALRKRYS